MCICVCVCVCERERERERKHMHTHRALYTSSILLPAQTADQVPSSQLHKQEKKTKHYFIIDVLSYQNYMHIMTLETVNKLQFNNTEGAYAKCS